VADRKILQFPQLRITSQRRLDGGVVLDGGVQSGHHALLEGRQNLNDATAAALGIPFTDELESGDLRLPGGASFGSIVQLVETGASFAEVSAAKVNEQVNNKPPDGSIPTADQILYTSYKTGGKCIIRIEDASGEDNDEGVFFEHFSLQSVSEPQEQRFQVHELFDGEKIFFFGRRPRFWTYSGIVRNAKDSVRISPGLEGPPRPVTQSFADQLIRMFQDRFAGSKAVERMDRVILTYEDIVVEGLMTNMLPARNSQFPSAVNVTFTMFVTNSSFIGQANDGESLSDVLNEFRRQSSVMNTEPIPGLITPAPPETGGLEDKKRKDQEAANFTAAEVQKAVNEEQALLSQGRENEEAVLDAQDALSAAEAELERLQNLSLSPGLVTPEELADARTEVDRAGSKLDDLNANQQELDSGLSIVTETLARKASDQQIAQAKGEYSAELLERYLTADELASDADTTGVVPADLVARIIENGGIIKGAESTLAGSSFSTDSGIISTLKVTVTYPDGKKGSKRVKFEDIFIRVKLP
jgi:hypothetical protein